MIEPPILYLSSPTTHEFIRELTPPPDPILRDPITFEPLSASLSNQEGWLIPAFTHSDTPPKAEKNQTVIWKDVKWQLVEDYRQETIYKIDDASQSKKVTELGAIPTGWTLKKPTEYSVWSTTKTAWVVDTDAQTTALENKVRSKRDKLLTDCDWRVVRAQELGTTLSDEWKAYRAALRNVPEQSGFPTAITWPTLPTSTSTSTSTASDSADSTSQSTSTKTSQSTATSAS